MGQLAIHHAWQEKHVCSRHPISSQPRPHSISTATLRRPLHMGRSGNGVEADMAHIAPGSDQECIGVMAQEPPEGGNHYVLPLTVLQFAAGENHQTAFEQARHGLGVEQSCVNPLVH